MATKMGGAEQPKRRTVYLVAMRHATEADARSVGNALGHIMELERDISVGLEYPSNKGYFLRNLADEKVSDIRRGSSKFSRFPEWDFRMMVILRDLARAGVPLNPVYSHQPLSKADIMFMDKEFRQDRIFVLDSELHSLYDSIMQHGSLEDAMPYAARYARKSGEWNGIVDGKMARDVSAMLGSPARVPVGIVGMAHARGVRHRLKGSNVVIVPSLGDEYYADFVGIQRDAMRAARKPYDRITEAEALPIAKFIIEEEIQHRSGGAPEGEYLKRIASIASLREASELFESLVRS